MPTRMTSEFRFPFVVVLALGLLVLCGDLSTVNAQRRGRGDDEGERDRDDRRGRWNRRDRDEEDENDRRGGRGRGSWDPSDFLKRLDRNGNGNLEPNEMSGRTSEFIRRMGMDPNETIPVDKLVERVQSQRNEREEQRREEAERASRKVPGFGATAEGDQQPVPDFSNSNSLVGLEQQFSKEVMDQVEDVLRRYDRNRNGQLEQSEVEGARWGNPSPQESDTNRDGTLTRMELARRYIVRERDRNQRRNERGQDDDDDDRRERGDRRGSRDSDSDNRSERSFGSSGRRSFASRDASRSRDSGSARVSTRSRSSNGSSGNSDRYLRYVEGLIERYDKNGDGKLDESEIREMRSPPKNADLDKDGFVTKQEYADVLSGRAKPGSDGDRDEDGGRSERESSRDSDRESTRERGDSRRSRSASFSENDANGDGQLQMHEYAQEWTSEIVAEFRRRDLNNDGVITAREWEKSR